MIPLLLFVGEEVFKESIDFENTILLQIKSIFLTSHTYEVKIIKELLSKIYKDFNIKRTAKSTDVFQILFLKLQVEVGVQL